MAPFGGPHEITLGLSNADFLIVDKHPSDMALLSGSKMVVPNHEHPIERKSHAEKFSLHRLRKPSVGNSSRRSHHERQE